MCGSQPQNPHPTTLGSVESSRPSEKRNLTENDDLLISCDVSLHGPARPTRGLPGVAPLPAPPRLLDSSNFSVECDERGRLWWTMTTQRLMSLSDATSHLTQAEEEETSMQDYMCMRR